LSDDHIPVVAFPAHKTKIFQPFAPVISGALKKLEATAHGVADDSMNDQITKRVEAYHQMATSMTVRESFRHAGLVRNTSVRRLELSFEEETMQETDELKENGIATSQVNKCPEGKKLIDWESSGRSGLGVSRTVT
jgi:hypothetical protein